LSILSDPLNALRDGRDLPATLEELRRPLLTAIDEIGEGLTQWNSAAEAGSSSLQLLPDSWQTLAIMGERGSGKSTLLASVSSELERRGQHLVVQTMRPEHFGDTDSVITTFLADLWDLLTLQARDDAENGSSATIESAGENALNLLADAQRAFAVSRTTTAALEQGTDSPTDFAEDFVTVSLSGVRLARQLLALATEICLRPGNADGPRLIIVPIDDPDLAHQSIVDILSDVQILGSVPGIVPLTCFSPSDLRDAWLAARRRMSPDTDDDRMTFLLHRHLEKLFPYRCRFEIEPIGPPQRAAFAPIGRLDPLHKKLADLRTNVEKVSGTTWAGDDAITSDNPALDLPSPLPDNARTLVQLWETLDVVKPEPDPTMLHLALRRMLDILTEGVEARIGSSMPNLIEIGPALPESPYKRSINTDLSRVRIVVSSVDSTAPDTTGEPAIASIRLRRVHRVRGAIATGGSSDLKPEDFLPGEIVSAMLALQEIEFGSGLFEPGGPRLCLDNSDWAFLQIVEIANQATDNQFLMLPEATTLSEVLRSVELWNRLGDLSGSLAPETTLATAVEAACLTVERETELKAMDDYAQAFDHAAAVYKSCINGKSNTQASFARWFENDLPLQWHSAFLSGERIRNLASSHRELRAAGERSAGAEQTSADSRSTSGLEHRLNVLLDALDTPDDPTQFSWVAGYFELASSVNSDHLDRLSRLYPAWQRDSAGVRAGAATFGSVTRTGANIGVAPFPTPEGTELLAAGKAALRRARAAARTSVRA
jgi:hypothetical protein